MQVLVIAAAFQLFDGAQTVAAGVRRGLQDKRVPMVIAVCGYWLAGYGPAIHRGFWTPLAGVGIWLGPAVGLVVVPAMLPIRRRMRVGCGCHVLASAGGRARWSGC